jgi:3-mercaptopyruvate sulfurtransferase SseA
VKNGDSITTYCHIGQQASLLYFVARYLGYERLHWKTGAGGSELRLVKSDAVNE